MVLHLCQHLLSALLFLGLVWAEDRRRSLHVSRQRRKFDEGIEDRTNCSYKIVVLSIATLAAQVGKPRYRAFDLPLKVTESMAKTD